jgi:hypothetical protein
MDVSPCNSLLDLRFLALVLSRTLNGSSENRFKTTQISHDFKRPVRFFPAFSLFNDVADEGRNYEPIREFRKRTFLLSFSDDAPSLPYRNFSIELPFQNHSGSADACG